MDIELSNLTVTQENARNVAQIPGMIDFVKNGGFFNRSSLDEYAKLKGMPSSPLFKLSRFEDGKLYIHDGHHRAISIHLSGRDYIREDEYEIREFKYSDYTDIAFIDDEGYDDREKGDWMGWVTPFDISTEMRFPDIKEYKDHVKSIYYNRGELQAIDYINSNSEKYKKTRELNSVFDLTNHMRLKHESI